MIKLIEDTASLEAFCAQLQNQKFITIDLEFIREKTYYAELALIQVGSEAECAIIDPLAPDLNMHSFFLLLENPKIEKVFPDGSLLVSCQTANYMQLLPTIKRWLPHIRVLAPKELNKQLKEELKAYLNKLL